MRHKEDTPPAWMDEIPLPEMPPHITTAGGARRAPPTSGWDPPSPLSAVASLPRFPIEALPAYLRDYVTALATSTQTPPDLAGMFVLAVSGACLAGKFRIHAWMDWQEPLNLYVAVFLPPGNRKSAVVAEVEAPLHEHERSLLARLAPMMQEARARVTIAKKRVAQAEKAAASAKAGADSEAAMSVLLGAVRERDAIRLPVEPRLTVDDCTPEKLTSLLSEHGGHIASVSAEGGVFDLMAGRYSANGGPNLDVYLKGHAGDSIRVDRIGRASERVDRPALTVALAAQPDVIRSMADTPEFLGRGLLARFLYSLPPSTVGEREARAPAIRESVRQRYRGETRRLLELKAMETQGATLHLSPAAEARLRRFVEELEPQLRESGALGGIREWACKLAGAVLRIAGIIHVCAQHDSEVPSDTAVSEATIGSAIAIGRYLIDHARAAFGLMGADPATGRAQHILAWISQGHGLPFSARDAFNACRGRLRNMTEVRAALTMLHDHGYVRMLDDTSAKRPGRPASPRYEVNPMGLAREGAHSTQSAEPFCE